MSESHRDPTAMGATLKSWGVAGLLAGLALGLVGGLLIVIVIQFSPGFGGFSQNGVSLGVFSLVVALAFGGVVGAILGLLNGLVLGLFSCHALLRQGVPHRQARISALAAATTAIGGLALLALAFRDDALFVLLPLAAGTAVSFLLSRRLPPSSRQ